jgi:hypothetical protein
MTFKRDSIAKSQLFPIQAEICPALDGWTMFTASANKEKNPVSW